MDKIEKDFLFFFFKAYKDRGRLMAVISSVFPRHRRYTTASALTAVVVKLYSGRSPYTRRVCTHYRRSIMQTFFENNYQSYRATISLPGREIFHHLHLHINATSTWPCLILSVPSIDLVPYIRASMIPSLYVTNVTLLLLVKVHDLRFYYKIANRKVVIAIFTIHLQIFLQSSSYCESNDTRDNRVRSKYQSSIGRGTDRVLENSWLMTGPYKRCRSSIE